MTTDNHLFHLRALSDHFKVEWAPNGYPIIDWAIEEIERLRYLVRELRPYLETDIKGGLSLGEPWVNHSMDGCEECMWYQESLSWKNRIEAGELDV